MLLKFSVTTHKERVLNQKPTSKLKSLFLKKILQTNISGHGGKEAQI